MVLLAFIPATYAMPTAERAFPDITFKAFSEFIGQNFSSKTSLSTVLVILFSLTENPDLLNLHARQQYAKQPGESSIGASGWIKCLARALKSSIDQNQRKPLKMKNVQKNMDTEGEITAFSHKIDAFAKLLHLHPFDKYGQQQNKLQPISQKLIQPVHLLCPNSMECETAACKSRSLLQITRTRDIPQVTLIKDSVIYDDVYILTGECPACKTKYFADHERAVEGADTGHSRVYLNSAKYLKIGQSVWVDRPFSQGVLSGIYNFHASAAAYAQYWNDSVLKHQSVKFKGITRRQVWQAFVQESIRCIASDHDIELTLRDGLGIEEVTKEAFAYLGEKGVIHAAKGHQCSECTHSYKRTSDLEPILDPAATVGIDEGQAVPVLDNINNAANPSSEQQDSDDRSDRMEVDNPVSQVTMAVLDGIVFGPHVSCIYFQCRDNVL